MAKKLYSLTIEQSIMDELDIILKERNLYRNVFIEDLLKSYLKIFIDRTKDSKTKQCPKCNQWYGGIINCPKCPL